MNEAHLSLQKEREKVTERQDRKHKENRCNEGTVEEVKDSYLGNEGTLQLALPTTLQAKPPSTTQYTNKNYYIHTQAMEDCIIGP